MTSGENFREEFCIQTFRLHDPNRDEKRQKNNLVEKLFGTHYCTTSLKVV